MVCENKQSQCHTNGQEQETGADDQAIEFEETLQKAIDDTLALLGSDRRRAFSARLRNEFNLDPTKLAQYPEALSSALDEMFGPAGQVVGRTVVTKAATACGAILPEDHNLKYVDRVRTLREVVLRQGQKPAPHVRQQGKTTWS